MDDSIADLETFASDLKDSAEDRLERGTAEVSELLSDCLDFEKLLLALGDLRRASQQFTKSNSLSEKQKQVLEKKSFPLGSSTF